MPRLLVVTASTRPGRIGAPIGEWAVGAAKAHGKFDVVSVDLAELDLPFLDEPGHPRMGRYEHEHTREWSAIVQDADAFLFVTPEYDHFMPASLVNAIQFLFWEWAYKPFGAVSYGGISAGLRGYQELKVLGVAMKMVPVIDGPVIPFALTMIKDGVFEPTPIVAETLPFHLDELYRWTEALMPLQAQVPELRKLLPPGAPKPPVGALAPR